MARACGPGFLFPRANLPSRRAAAALGGGGTRWALTGSRGRAPRGGRGRTRNLAVDDQNLANVLDGGRARARADLREQRLAPYPVFAGNPDLDELVCLQAAVDFGNDAFRKTGAADDYHRTERMRPRLEGTARGRIDRFHRPHCKGSNPALGTSLQESRSGPPPGMGSKSVNRKAKSRAWMQAHATDPYVQQAVAKGYRSRAAYKLAEIDDHDRLLRRGQIVVDLGAAPGSWSQFISERVMPGGRIIALDLLHMESMAGVSVIEGDFREQAVLGRLETALQGKKVDLVVSDMAPNLSGVSASDQARAVHLCELALEFAQAHLKPGGAFLVKAFQGAGFAAFLAQMKAAFESVASRKPRASRGRSAEMYLLGRRLRTGMQAGDSGVPSGGGGESI